MKKPNVDLVPDSEVTDEQHEEHCRLAECRHPAVLGPHRQGWCARCRAVAFGSVFEGIAYVGGKIVNVNSANGRPS